MIVSQIISASLSKNLSSDFSLSSLRFCIGKFLSEIWAEDLVIHFSDFWDPQSTSIISVKWIPFSFLWHIFFTIIQGVKIFRRQENLRQNIRPNLQPPYILLFLRSLLQLFFLSWTEAVLNVFCARASFGYFLLLSCFLRRWVLENMLPCFLRLNALMKQSQVSSYLCIIQSFLEKVISLPLGCLSYSLIPGIWMADNFF